MRTARTMLILALAGLAPACSDEHADSQALERQATEAIGKAEDVNKLVQDAAERDRKAIDEQSR